MRLKSTLSFFILLHLFSSSAFSDDTLTALQQDVVLAKQKYEAIAGKTDSVVMALDREKATQVQQEADRLMEQLKESYDSSEPVTLVKEEKRPPRSEVPPTFLQRQDAAKPIRVPTAIPAIDAESPAAHVDIDRKSTRLNSSH